MGRGRARGRRCLAFASLAILVACSGPDTDDESAKSCGTGTERLAVARNEPSDSSHPQVWIEGSVVDPELLTEDWYATRPSFSPDGRQVAVTKALGIYEGAGPKSTDIWIVDTDGRRERRLTTGVAKDFYDHAAWSPDGERIAVSHTSPGGGSGIELIPVKTGNNTGATAAPVIPTGTAPAWAPTGQELAYVRGVPGPALRAEIRVVDLDDGSDRLVGEVTAPVTTLDWSPDGRTLLASASPFFGSAHAIDVDSGEVTDLGDLGFARWSGDGRRVYFMDGSGTLKVGSFGDGGISDSRSLGTESGYVFPHQGLAVDRCNRP